MEDLIAKAEHPCMVVAHPDDECLWGAGLILRYPGDWLIVCCTIPHTDPIRLDKFLGACQVLDSEPHLLNHPERAGLIPLDKLNLNDRDLIVTHNAAGEYGHVQHKEVHTALKDRYAGHIVFFGYGLGNPKLTIELNETEWETKLRALKCYDHTSPKDRRPKWEALLDYYGKRYDLRREPYIYV